MLVVDICGCFNYNLLTTAVHSSFSRPVVLSIEQLKDHSALPYQIAPGTHSRAEMPEPTRICCLISGNGSNLQALIDAVSSGMISNARIDHVVCNREGAYGRERARKAGIRETYHNLVKYSKVRKSFSSPDESLVLMYWGLQRYPSGDEHVKHGKEAREAYDGDLASIVLSTSPQLVVW